MSQIIPPHAQTVEVQFIKSCEVAESVDMRGHVVLMIRTTMGQEYALAYRDEGAMTTAHQIVRNITNRRGLGKPIVAQG